MDHANIQYITLIIAIFASDLNPVCDNFSASLSFINELLFT